MSQMSPNCHLSPFYVCFPSDPGDSDDLLDEKYTDKDGEFRVDGTTREMTPIDPVLYIYHDCEDSIKVSRIFQFPDK